MDKIVLIIISVIAFYILFRALKSTIGILFKIAIIILALSFMGYNILDYKYAIMPSGLLQDTPETAYYPEVNITTETNLTSDQTNYTIEQANITNNADINQTQQ